MGIASSLSPFDCRDLAAQRPGGCAPGVRCSMQLNEEHALLACYYQMYPVTLFSRVNKVN